ncbi:hypothetical protein BDR03DRAFT_955011, partial [Suillus americanus]
MRRAYFNHLLCSQVLTRCSFNLKSSMLDQEFIHHANRALSNKLFTSTVMSLSGSCTI